MMVVRLRVDSLIALDGDGELREVHDARELSDDVCVGVGVGGYQVGEVVGSVVVVVVHFCYVGAGGSVESFVENVAEDHFFGAGDHLGGVGELAGDGLDVGEVEVVLPVENEDEFFVFPVLIGDVGEGVFDVFGSFGGEEDADSWCGVGGDVEVGENLFESVFSSVVGEDVTSSGDRDAFSGWGVSKGFEVGLEFCAVGGGEVVA